VSLQDSSQYGNPLGIVGNKALLARLTRDAREHRLSHAYIIDGKPGSGKHAIARHIAAALSCHQRPGRVAGNEEQMGFFDDEPITSPDPDAPLPCGICPGCRKVLENISPDVIWIGRGGKATLGVDAVRQIRESVYLSPGEGDTKIYIIEDAETMTPQAQNALLLTLEEPPSYVLFLLLCNGAEYLLETIRSRAPILHTQPLFDDDIRKYMIEQKKSLPTEEMNALLICADGAIGQALALSDAKSLHSIMKQRELVDSFITGITQNKKDVIPTAISRFGNKREEVLALLALISLAIRDLLLIKKSETSLLKYYTDRESAAELSALFTSRILLRINDALEGAREDLSRNANVRLTLTHMCLTAGLL